MQRVSQSVPPICLLIAASTAFAAELNGVVVDQTGFPASGITVKLLTSEMMGSESVAIAETKSDSAGRFNVAVPERWLGYPDTLRQELRLLAGSRDQGIGGVVVSRNLPLPERSLQITLEHWSAREVKLVDSEGNPLSDISLNLTALLLPIVPPPADQAAARYFAPLPASDMPPAVATNRDGIAELYLPPQNSIGSLQADLGNSMMVTWLLIQANPEIPSDWSQRLQLPELIEIPLQITADPDAALNDLSLSARCTRNQSSGPLLAVQQNVVIDSRGTATVTVLADVPLNFVANAPKFPDWRLDRPFVENTSSVDGGIELNFKEGISVSGRVVDSEGAPASRMNLLILAGNLPAESRTDKSGHYELLAAPGQQVLVLVAQSGYRGPLTGPESIVTIPADAESFKIPDIVVTRLRTVTGRVDDGSGRPVADASILMLWEEPHPQVSGARNNPQETVQTDDDGRFKMAGIDPDATLQMAAWSDRAASEAMLRIPPAELADPIEIVISTESMIAAEGRVVDQAGRGIPDLPVLLRHRVSTPLVDASLPIGEDVVEVATDNDGRFGSPRTLRPWGEYVAVIREGSPLETMSGWKAPAGGNDLQFPDIVSTSVTQISGRVVTTTGEPVPGADVRLLTSSGQTRTSTGIDGRFVIEAVAGRDPLLIASADGFSFNGLKLGNPSQDVSIVLAPRGKRAPDLNASVERNLPPKWSLQQRRNLAVYLYESLADTDLQTRTSALKSLAPIDPDYVMERLEELPANNPAVLNVGRSLAMIIAGKRPTEALELVDRVPDTGMRLYVLLAVEPRADLGDDERRQLLARIVQDSRGVASADHRVMSLGLVGERLLDLGERESGEALLREGHELAKNLAPAAFSGYVRGAFAEELAQVDADAALALIEPLTDDDEFNRHLTNIAHELATIDPQRAAESLDLMREMQTDYIVKSRDGAVIRVCYRMVRVDPERAVGLVDSIEDDVNRVRCLGVMADSLLAQDVVTDDPRTLAGELIETAWDVLAELSSADQSEVSWLFPSTMAGLLLPATAELFPDELSSRIWQTIALRRPMVNSGPYMHVGATCCSEIALLLAEIEAVQVQQVAAWLPDEASDKSAFEYFIQFTRTAPELITTTAPERIERYLSALDDDAARNRAIVAFIAALSRSGESRRRAIQNDMGLWFPDDEDLGPME